MPTTRSTPLQTAKRFFPPTRPDMPRARMPSS
jgi:hypothetical protein